MTVFISCDIETNGPIPNPNSILQLGAAAFDRNGELISTYQVNLEELPGGTLREDHEMVGGAGRSFREDQAENGAS